MINTIIDIYSGNDIDFQATLEGGTVAIIHKATEGTTHKDSRYLKRRDRAKEMGFLWGAYHFSSGDDVASQVELFLTHARPEDGELIALDWEPSSHGENMTLSQARKFVQMIKNETGRWPVLYGGHLIRESVDHQPDPILANCPLWYARYSDAPIGIPTQIWASYTLWQYTDGEKGPMPHDTPGTHGADRNIFQGSAADLAAQWPFTKRDEGTPLGPGFSVILG